MCVGLRGLEAFVVVFALSGPALVLARAQAAPGSAAPAQGSAAGPPGAAGAASRGAANAGTTSAVQGARAATQNGAASIPGQSPAAAYAASVSPALDPRKPAPSRPGALTLQQILEAAKKKNPTLLAAQANLRSVRAQEIQAGVRANPYFTLYGTNVTLPAAGAANPYAYSAQVSRLFERGQKRRWRLDAARAATGQTEAQLRDSVRQTELTVKLAFTRMLSAKQALELSQGSLKDFEHEVAIGRDRYKAGDLGKLDYERLDLQLASFESDAETNKVALVQASEQLQTLMGIENPSADFDIAGQIVPPAVSDTRDHLLQQALAQRPDYAASVAAVNVADANARLAIASGTTDPTLEGEYDRSGVYNSAGFSINVPLRVFDRNQGNKEATRFQADASRLTQTAVRYQVISDVNQAWVGYTQARALSERFNAHYLDESRDIVDIAQYAFEHGGIALTDYLDVLREARSSSSDALNSFANTWNAIHQLSAATATELVP